MDSLLQVLHFLGTALDFLNSMLCSHVKGLAQNLEEQLGSEEADVRLIGSNNLLSLSIHATYVVLIAVVELVHLANEVVSFVC